MVDKLKEATKDILSEESLEEIETAFNTAVDNAVNDKLALHVEKALLDQDDSHSKKLEALLETIDTDHTQKLNVLVEAIDKDHAVKLNTMVRRYRGIIGEQAEQFKSQLVESISDYIELYLKQSLPEDMLAEAVNNKRATAFLGELRDLLAVDNAMSKGAIKDAVLDGKQKLDESAAGIKALQDENHKLKSQQNQLLSTVTLERKCAGLSKAKATDITRLLKDKDAQFINENFEYTLKMFDKAEDNRLEEIKADAIQGATTKDVDRPVLVQEQTQVSPEAESNHSDPLFNTYMGELGKY